MPKKVAKGSSRSGGGAAREFQRRTRVGETSTLDSNTPVALQDGDRVEISAAPTSGNGATNGSSPPAAPRPASNVGINANTRFRGTVSPGVAPRASATRAAAPLYGGPLGGRSRAANAASLSIDDELSYIKGDLRRLIILAGVSFVALLVLGFILTR
jgi:hypothetical protein